MDAKKKLIFSSLAALTVLSVAAGSASAVLAAGNKTGQATNKNVSHSQRPTKLTETQRNELQVKLEAVQAAISAGDYQAWVKAQVAINKDCPLLSKITAANFSRYVESIKLHQQADAISQELGIGRGSGHYARVGFDHAWPSQKVISDVQGQAK